KSLSSLDSPINHGFAKLRLCCTPRPRRSCVVCLSSKTTREMPGIGDMLGVWEIKEVKGRPRQAEARELLQKLADQVKPICVAHKWK
ncbi:unnamed protein product, partial [Ectocarpus fasciculatus]